MSLAQASSAFPSQADGGAGKSSRARRKRPPCDRGSALSPRGRRFDAAMGVARDYVQVAPIPLALTKAVFANGAVSLEQALTAEVDYQLLLFGTADHRDAAKVGGEAQDGTRAVSARNSAP